MAGTIRKTRMKEVPLSEIRDDLSGFLHKAQKQEIIITRTRKAGWSPEEDWFDYKLEHDPRFVKRVEQARKSLKAGQGIRLEDVTE
jgi:hypothetical protein